MLSPLRNRFGIPGVISVVALVFAMFGGAYAANNSGDGATASAKAKRGPKGPKGATGPAGPMGPAGPQGLAGADGKAGSNGVNGTDGADGKTVLSGTTVPTGAIGTIGDFYIETDVSTIYGPKAASGANGGWGTGTALEGEDGSPWTAGGTLPSGETETGAWSLLIGSEFVGMADISFPIPLAAGISAVHVSGEPNFAVTCPGTAANPEAALGHLCVYVAYNEEISFVGIDKAGGGGPGASVSGAVLIGIQDTGESGKISYGTWAVTAPAS